MFLGFLVFGYLLYLAMIFDIHYFKIPIFRGLILYHLFMHKDNSLHMSIIIANYFPSVSGCIPVK